MDIIPTFLLTYELVDSETLESRNAICRSCNELQEETCKVCHCKVFAKNEFAEAKCPLGKWA